MRRSNRRLLTVCICFVALTSVQCGRGVGGNDTESPTLTIHVPNADERMLGPNFVDLSWFLVFLGLADGSEYALDPEPRLLDRWDHTPDYTEWTLHVREGVRWGDGVPVTAEDVKFSLELWTNPNIAYEHRYFETIKVLDTNTLRMTFKEPASATVFVYNWLAIVPKHLLDSLDVERMFSWLFWIQPVGDGPYRYVSHIPGVMTALEANPDYYGRTSNIPSIVLRYGGNGLTELLSGNVDITTRVTPLEALSLSADPRFRIYHKVLHSQHVAIVWNHRNSLFQDADIRRALTMSIDRRELHRILNYPDDLTIFDVPANTRHHVQGMVPDPLPFDPERASRLFATAEWVDTNGDDILDRNGQDFQFTLLTSTEAAAQAVYIQDQLRRAGILMEIGTYDRNAVRVRTRSHDFDAAIVTYNYIEQFGSFPMSGYENPEVSRLRDAAWFTIDPNEVDRHMRELWRIVGAEIPVTYLYPELRYLAAHRRVRGLQNTGGRIPTDTPLPLILERLWIEDEP